MSKERRLGRGLEALLSKPLDGSAEAPLSLHYPTGTTEAAPPSQQKVGVYDIERNPFQPRREFDEAEIDSLSDSLQEHGLLQPVLVRRIDERYQLVAGERRLRAAIKAGWNEVPVQVVEADDRQTAEIAIVENLQRKDLNPLEKAASFQRYLETYGCTQDDLAKRLQIDRSTIANLIRLLELPEEVQQAVRSGQITQGHARALLPLGDEREQVDFCRRVTAEGMSVRTVETLVQETIHAADAEPLSVVTAEGQRAPVKRTRSKHIASLEQELRTALGTKVDIRQGAKGRGKIAIHFANADEFERLYQYLCAEPVGQGQVG
ncbi:MAG TPA: ParB/RepB/Spo0J family partition protein [Pirellulales bacterium]|nr:ParB/RepB/Spo0J family partition protein [Pirellulales bacterium]